MKTEYGTRIVLCPYEENPTRMDDVTNYHTKQEGIIRVLVFQCPSCGYRSQFNRKRFEDLTPYTPEIPEIQR